MKKLFMLLASSVVICSCSDNLSKSKVEDLLEECNKKTPKQETVGFTYGKMDFDKSQSDQEKLTKYQKLADEGLITLKNTGGNNYDVQLTEKTSSFVLSQEKEKGGFFSNRETGRIEAKIKACDYEIDEVIEIQEVPAYNAAEARIKYKRINKNPFLSFSYSKDTDFDVSRATFRKTDNGWKACD